MVDILYYFAVVKTGPVPTSGYANLDLIGPFFVVRKMVTNSYWCQLNESIGRKLTTVLIFS